jgi:hypothetical protein
MMVLALSKQLFLAVWILYACNYNAAANTGTQTVHCVYPIPNATITIGGTDPNYGATGPAYFNTGSPVSNLSKTVKHIVNQMIGH